MSDQLTDARNPNHYPAHMPDTHLDTLGHDTVRADLEALELQLQNDSVGDRVDELERELESKQSRKDAPLKDRVLGSLGLNNQFMSSQREGWIHDELATLKNYAGVTAEVNKGLIEDSAQYVDDALDKTRNALLWLRNSPKPTREGAEVSIFESMSDYQRSLYHKDREQRRDLTVFDWLAETRADSMPETTEAERITKELQRANDKQRLLNFLQSHNEFMAERQQRPEFIEQVKRQKETWAAGVRRGLAEGWLHEGAVSQLDRLDDFQVYEGDFFTTYLNHRGGYYRHIDTNQVSVARNDVEYATVHELNHALLETFPEDPRQVFNQHWIVESITEELAQSMRSGQFGEFVVSDGGYREERGLLKTVLDISEQLGAGVTFSDFTRAYSAPEEQQNKIVYNIIRRFHAVGYPDRNIFASIDDILRQTGKEIDADPVHRNLSRAQRQGLTAEMTAGKLHAWAKTMTPSTEPEQLTTQTEERRNINENLKAGV